MKILISSKYLLSKLNEIDFKNNYVKNIELLEYNIVLNTCYKSIEFTSGHFTDKSNELLIKKTMFEQSNRRWDWVKQLVGSISEQPILLEIRNDFLEIILQY